MLSHLRRNAVAYLALFVALGGTSFAAAKLGRNSVGNKAIKAGAVTNTKIARNAVTGGKVKNGSLTKFDFKKGTLLKGATGDRGPAGPSTGRAGGDLTGTYPNPTLKPLGDWTNLSIGRCNFALSTTWTLGPSGTNVPQFRIDRDGVVHLRGAMTCPQAFSIQPGVVMPTGARPLKDENAPIVEKHGSTPQLAYLTVQPDGEFLIALSDATANAFVSFDGVSFDTKH